MIETIEKFPNLRVIDSVIDEIKDLIDYDENPIQFWIAGGAVTAAITGAKINDYDIFSPTPKLLKEKLQAGIGYNTFENEHFTNFWVDSKKVQVVTRYEPKTAEEIFNTFDFTIVCGAYDGTTFYHHDRFWQDIAVKRMVINELTFPMKTLERVVKYANRGYKLCPVGLLKLVKTINALEVDWENPDENQLSYYPDGTARFTGVD